MYSFPDENNKDTLYILIVHIEYACFLSCEKKDAHSIHFDENSFLLHCRKPSAFLLHHEKEVHLSWSSMIKFPLKVFSS